MGKLSSAIVQRKLATLRDVEEALARQVLYGGDLATNLLEQAPGTDEQALVDLLAETSGLSAAPAGELPRASEDVVRLVPGDIALRHGLYPLEQRDGTLVVAVSEPLRSEVEQDLGFGLGVSIAQRVAPLVRVRQAISRDYGLPLDRRSHRVLAKLEGKPDPSPSVAPLPLDSAPEISSLPRPPTMPPLGLPPPTDMASFYAAKSPPGVRIIPTVAVGAAPSINEPAILRELDESPSPSPSADPISIHERLTSPAPPVSPVRGEETAPWPFATALGDLAAAARVTAPAPAAAPARAPAAPAPAPAPPSRSSGSGRYAIPDLAAWTAETKLADRRGRTRHRGPYTAAAAEQDLFASETRDGVLNAFFDFISQYFEYSALFAVHGDLAEGRTSHGPGADHAKITGIGVPLDLPSAFATARREGRFCMVALATDGLDARLSLDLERSAGKKVLLLPILVRNRCVLIFYGDDGDGDVDLSEIGDVIAFAPLVASALESMILRRKSTVRPAVDEPAPSLRPSLRQRPPRPSREERAEVLAQALENTLRSSSPRSSRPPRSKMAPAQHAAVPVSGHEGDGKRIPTEPATPSARISAAPPGSPASPSEPPGPVFPLHRRTSLGDTDAVPDDGWDVASASAKSNDPVRSVPSASSSPSDPPDISIGMAELDFSPTEEEPESQAVVVPAKRLAKGHSSAELRLPTVIVNVDNDLGELVRRLIAGDETVGDRLVKLGASAASVLVSHFPGPLRVDTDRLGPPELASLRGPVLGVLARIGQLAVPFIAVRSNDADPKIRIAATELLGEIPSVDSAQAIGRRVTDSNADVRRAAVEAGKRLLTDDDVRAALRDKILTVAEDRTASIDARVAAIEAIAAFRDGRSVPRLIRLATVKDEAGRSAEWALGIVARQAFGNDAAAWDAWWKEHSDEHRIEWLIDALMHDDAELRRAAGEELKALTKEYFGYYDDLSKGERAKAQRRYREWWEATGKAKFQGE